MKEAQEPQIINEGWRVLPTQAPGEIMAAWHVKIAGEYRFNLNDKTPISGARNDPTRSGQE
jgi:hypothetical protein